MIALIILFLSSKFNRMETLQEAAIEMLKEFKVLLNFTPLPINTNRLIQLLALNMFAIDNGQLKGMVTNDNISSFFRSKFENCDRF